MDPLSDILTRLEFRGMLYFATEFTAPWGIRVPEHRNVIRFHLVTRGACTVRVAGEKDGVVLNPGDFALVPHGASHDLMHDRTARPLPLDRVLEDANYDGSGTLVWRIDDRGQESRLVCGHFSFDEKGAGRRFLAALPPLIVARGMDEATAAWIAASLKLLDAEQGGDDPGGEAIVRRVTEILFVQAVRHWMRAECVAPSVMRALADPQMARALGAVHRDPARRWTVQEMAAEAGLSRSVMAERFHALAGITPMDYVTTWRLELARSQLSGTDLSVDEIAASVGYQSAAAFSRAYSARFGEGPGATRRRSRAG